MSKLFLYIGLILGVSVCSYASDDSYKFELFDNNQQVVPVNGIYVIGGNNYTFEYELDKLNDPQPKLIGKLVRQNADQAEVKELNLALESNPIDFLFKVKYVPGSAESLAEYAARIKGSSFLSEVVLTKDKCRIRDVSDRLKFSFTRLQHIKFIGNPYPNEFSSPDLTNIYLDYAMAGENVKRGEKVIATVAHDLVKEKLLKGYYYLNENHEFEEVYKITRRTVEPHLAAWATSNAISQKTYYRIMHKPIRGLNRYFALPSAHQSDWDPSQDVGKYFSLRGTSPRDFSGVFYSDSEKMHFTVAERWHLWVANLETKDNSQKLLFDYSLPCRWAEVVRPTQEYRIFPSGDHGLQNGVQILPTRGKFKSSFYSLAQVGGVQKWTQLAGGNNVVETEIKGLELTNNALGNILGIPQTVYGSQVTLDISNHYDRLSGDPLREFIKYVQSVHWLTGMKPILRCSQIEWGADDRRNDVICEKINELINETRCLKLDFPDDFCFLVQDEGCNWSIRTQRGFNQIFKTEDKSVWRLAGPEPRLYFLLQKLKKEIKVLDMRTYEAKYFVIFGPIVAFTELKAVKMTQLPKPGLKLSEDTIKGLLNKVDGLEILSLHKHLGDIRSLNLGDALMKNASTLKQVDLTNCKMADGFLRAHYSEQFLTALGFLDNLESLKISGTGLSNGQLETLSGTLKGLKKLSVLEMDLLQVPIPVKGFKTGLELGFNATTDCGLDIYRRWNKRGILGKIFLLPIDVTHGLAMEVAGLCIALPVCTLVFTAADTFGEIGISMGRLLSNLAGIESLTDLKLCSFGVIFKQHASIKVIFEDVRAKLKISSGQPLGPVKIDFIN